MSRITFLSMVFQYRSYKFWRDFNTRSKLSKLYSTCNCGWNHSLLLCSNLSKQHELQSNNFEQCSCNRCPRPFSYCHPSNANYLRRWYSAKSINGRLYQWSGHPKLPVEPSRHSDNSNCWCNSIDIHSTSFRVSWTFQLYRNDKYIWKWLYRQHLCTDCCCGCCRPYNHGSTSNSNTVSKCNPNCFNRNSFRRFWNIAIPMV